MPAYTPLNVQKKYNFFANPPTLDKIAFTIDHIHAGNHFISSTYEVVKTLTDRNIPVTVFIQATNPSNDYEFDRKNAQLIYDLNRQLVTLGIHPNPKGTSQQQQEKTVRIIRDIIKDVTGEKSIIMSYHGRGAGPEVGITFPDVKYARGIHSRWAVGADNPLDTPVAVFSSVKRSFDYTHERNSAGLSSTLFVHTAELSRNSIKRRIFDTYIREVQQRRLQAVSYFDAMHADFNDNSLEPNPPVEPTVFGVIRLSALSNQGNRPVKVDFKLEHETIDQIFTADNVKTKQFHIPVGDYKITATADGAAVTDRIRLTKFGGIHHIFHV